MGLLAHSVEHTMDLDSVVCVYVMCGHPSLFSAFATAAAIVVVEVHLRVYTRAPLVPALPDIALAVWQRCKSWFFAERLIEIVLICTRRAPKARNMLPITM